MATYHDLLQKLQVTEPTSFAEQQETNGRAYSSAGSGLALELHLLSKGKTNQCILDCKRSDI
ncbi:hypothetical protein MTR_1g052390 [Medicago truncatula]|uniref:Uncharacterized protein n=1 Tax=Medicago truncatula TaxID=3880 RepID=A0A072VIX5_MEDTR|nr:hypothetical protein MTR_1g052390 [Medicago truncatula]